MNRLYRSPDDRVIAGVAGGMAEAWDLDPAIVRVGWAFLILITGGLFLLLYLVMAIVVPLRPFQTSLWSAAGAPAPMGPDGQPTSAPPPGPVDPDLGTPPPLVPRYERHYRRERHDGAGPLVFGLILIVVGAFFLLRQYIPTLDFGLIWPLIVIGGGVLLIVAALNRPQHQS